MYRNLGILFAALFCAGNYRGANLYEHYLGKEIETYILYLSAILAIVFGVLFTGAKLKWERSLITINNRLYTPTASNYVFSNAINPLVIESAINQGRPTVSSDTIKYKWKTDENGYIIVILNKKNVVLEVLC